MMPPDATASIAAQRRAALLAAASRRRALHDLSLSRQLTRHHAVGPVRFISRLAMRPRPMLRASPAVPLCDCCPTA
jgi:hypothetical protein